MNPVAASAVHSLSVRSVHGHPEHQGNAGSTRDPAVPHGTHRLVSHRLGGDPLPRFLTGGVACYRIYATADARHLTVGALEPKFFARLCVLIERPELAARQFDPDGQVALAAELDAVFQTRPLAEWLELFDGEDVCVGPVATLAEGAVAFGSSDSMPSAAIGQHTDAWRGELDSR